MPGKEPDGPITEMRENYIVERFESKTSKQGEKGKKQYIGGWINLQ